MDMENKLVETYNDGNFVTFLFLDKKVEMLFIMSLKLMLVLKTIGLKFLVN